MKDIIGGLKMAVKIIFNFVNFEQVSLISVFRILAALKKAGKRSGSWPNYNG